MLWTSHMSGYLMEPIRDNKDFKGDVRHVKNGQKGQTGKKVIFKGNGSLHTLFFSVMGETRSGVESSNVRVTY